MILLAEINTELVKKLIKEQFPQWSDLPINPVVKSGNDNRTFHLGNEMSVRLPSAERYALQVEKEQLWLPKLKPHISLPISVPIAKGGPGEGYPWKWSVCQWIEGNSVNTRNIQDMNQFAIDLAKFLKELQSIEKAGAPLAGKHNFYRGGSISVYDEETRTAIRNKRNILDNKAISKIWNKALESEWREKPVWVHGDIAPGNLLVDNEGKLSGVIDFGVMGVGDPSCDLAIAWTFFDDESRQVFKKSMALDEETWIRGRGWALWKSLITYDAFYKKDTEVSLEMERIIGTITKDFNEKD